MNQIIFHGHACVELKTVHANLLIDPFLTGNPMADVGPEDVNPDYIIVTHAHSDHLGDTEMIAKRTNAKVISNFEIVSFLQSKGINGHPLHIGGSYHFPFGSVKLTIAHHGSTSDEAGTLGVAAGVLVKTDGKTLYHAGDTGLFYDMKLIGEMNKINVALLPIGGNFTMNIDDAVKAAELLKPEVVIPIHYNTFDVIKADPREFAKKLSKKNVKTVILEPGENFSF